MSAAPTVAPSTTDATPKARPPRVEEAAKNGLSLADGCTLNEVMALMNLLATLTSYTESVGPTELLPPGMSWRPLSGLDHIPRTELPPGTAGDYAADEVAHAVAELQESLGLL